MSKVCNATEREYTEIGCGRDQERCNTCCLFHKCTHGWEDKNVWKGCKYFDRGVCSYS